MIRRPGRDDGKTRKSGHSIVPARFLAEKTSGKQQEDDVGGQAGAFWRDDGHHTPAQVPGAAATRLAVTMA